MFTLSIVGKNKREKYCNRIILNELLVSLYFEILNYRYFLNLRFLKLIIMLNLSSSWIESGINLLP
jgi:hypothetical protein